MPKRNPSLALAWIAVVAPAGSAVIASAGAAAGSTRLATGLYDMSDGTVQAVGTLERSRLEGKVVMAIGKRQEGASTRTAGPEMAVDTVEEISDTGGSTDDRERYTEESGPSAGGLRIRSVRCASRLMRPTFGVPEGESGGSGRLHPAH